MYRNLGETDSCHNVNVQIICATTENAESTLLSTFIRRIPMIIKLPILNERSLRERFEIINIFFKAEAKCINSKIKIMANALIALLLYECPKNIGQLRSDIKLCCARAFLRHMSRKNSMIIIELEDFPEYVRKGIFKHKDYKEKIDRLVQNDIIISAEDYEGPLFKDRKTDFNFYEFLENRKKELEAKALRSDEIKGIINFDIENYLKRYISNLKDANLQ